MNTSENEFDKKALIWEKDPVRALNAKKVADEIIKAIGTSSMLSGFEYGCGTGLVSFNLQSSLKHIVMADSSKGMVKVTSEKIEQSGVTNMSVIEADLTSGLIDDRKYGLIYTMLTMHHIEDVKKMLLTFNRMLENGGYLFIADIDKEDGSFHGVDFTGHKGFDRLELLNWCKSAGFSGIDFMTVTTIVREQSDGSKKVYPVFLMRCRKN
jgi:ubiquinone/menaquinone biosynthesis C-methylase UbiE